MRILPGVSWSWRRAIGLSAFKGRISRATGVPLTRSGMERKAGRVVLAGIGAVLLWAGIVALAVIGWLS